MSSGPIDPNYYGTDLDENFPPRDFTRYEEQGKSNFYFFGGNDYGIRDAADRNQVYVDMGAGNDTYVGSDYGYDQVHGNSGNDNINGGQSADRLDGDAGQDTIMGGDGNWVDLIGGGNDRDILTGGGGSDQFYFSIGESVNSSAADRITDWYGDKIVTTDAGTASNYREEATTSGSAATVKSYIEGSSAFNGKEFAFLYNAKADLSFFMSDLDHNGSFETGVIFEGVGSASQMDYSNILHA